MKRIKLPEETSYATITMPKGDIKKTLTEYIIKNRYSSNLGFEFSYSKNINPVFITGKDKEENIPLVKFPVVVTTNNISYIVSNLLGSMKAEITNDSIFESKRSDYVDFETMRNMLVYYTLSNQDIDMVASYTAQIATIWLSKTIKNYLRLDHNTEADVEIALFIYFIRQFTLNTSNEQIKQKVNNFLSTKWKSANEMIDINIARLDSVDLDMGTYIRTIANDHPATAKLETSTINSFISNNWYSGADSSNIQIFIATENLHTMASIIYHASETATGKKSLLGRLLSDYKRSIKIEDLIHILKQMIKDRTI